MKTQQLYAILQELALVQTNPPNIDANTDLLNLLTVRYKHTYVYISIKSQSRRECVNVSECVDFLADHACSGATWQADHAYKHAREHS